VEQKNGVVVRQVVGHARLIGEHACQQLVDLYRALPLYVNGFPPCMKLVAKPVEGRTVRRVYEAAKTPLQRLLLSGVLSASRKQELRAAAMTLDPIRLLHHLEQRQRAVFRCEVSGSSASQQASVTSLLKFELEDDTAKPLLSEAFGRVLRDRFQPGAAHPGLSTANSTLVLTKKQGGLERFCPKRSAVMHYHFSNT
jgi:hypothetical protein